jgi:hypothetical protein
MWLSCVHQKCATIRYTREGPQKQCRQAHIWVLGTYAASAGHLHEARIDLSTQDETMNFLRSHVALRVALVGIALLGGIAMAQSVRADTLAVSADLPVAMSLTANSGGTSTSYSASSVSGLGLGVSLPFLVGLGYEDYTGKFSKSGNKFDYGVTMYDIFLNLPIPIVNIAIGGGIGNGAVSNSNSGVSKPFKDADLTQWFASLGFSILPFVDLHLGYHSFSGNNKAKTVAFNDLKVDGNMTSLGVKIGF